MLENENLVLRSSAPEPDLLALIHYQDGLIQAVTLTSSPSKGLHWAFQASQKDPLLEALIDQWMQAYRQKEPSPLPLPFALHALPHFTQQVLRALGRIPCGSITTYGQIAALLGDPNAARAVGGACRRNPFPLLIPCHRVLDAKKQLRGFSAGGISVKQALLDFENAHLV